MFAKLPQWLTTKEWLSDGPSTIFYLLPFRVFEFAIGAVLMMRFADCVPVLLHDPIRQVVGLAHAGWMGTVRGTVSAAVKAMQERDYRRMGLGVSLVTILAMLIGVLIRAGMRLLA